MDNFFKTKITLISFVFIIPITMGFLSINSAQNQEVMNPFITLWDVNGTDTSSTAERIVTIPLQNIGYNFDYTWTFVDDPSIQISGNHTNADGDFITTFTTGEVYELSITGGFQIMRNYEKNKLLDVIQWGDISWRSMQSMFEGWPGHGFTATDAPDLSLVSDMIATFRNTPNFNGNIGHWNVSNTNSFFRLFQSAISFDQDISNWNVSNVNNMNATFENARSFNQNISGWNVSKVTGLNNTFRNADKFNQAIGNWDISSVTSMIATFRDNNIFNQDLSGWDVSNVTSFREIFSNAVSFNQSLGNWKFKPGANFREAFVDATAMDCQSWSSTILGWNFSNPNLTELNVGNFSLIEFDTIAAIAMDELVNERAWTISGTPFIGNCGATFEFPCSDTLQIENETLFGDISIPADVQVKLKDVDFIQPADITMRVPEIKIESLIVVSIGANIITINEAGCN